MTVYPSLSWTGIDHLEDLCTLVNTINSLFYFRFLPMCLVGLAFYHIDPLSALSNVALQMAYTLLL